MFTCRVPLHFLSQPCRGDWRLRDLAARRGTLRGRETGEMVMKEFIESAKRETGDSNVVTLLTTAVIALAAIVMAATSFTLA